MGCSAVTFIEFIVFGVQAFYWYCKSSDDEESPPKDTLQNGHATKAETQAQQGVEKDSLIVRKMLTNLILIRMELMKNTWIIFCFTHIVIAALNQVFKVCRDYD